MRLPPYGKPLADARRRGLVPRRLGLGHVVVTLGWHEPSAAHPRVVLPEEEAVEEFDLAFLCGLHVTVIHDDYDAHRVPDAVEALLAAGAAQVDAVNRDTLEWPRYEPGSRHAA